MILKKTFLSFLLLAGLLAFIPEQVLAAVSDDSGGGGLGNAIPKFPQISDLAVILQRVITFLIGIVGGISIILIAVGGIKYILASGDPKATEGARHTITFAVFGLVIVLLAVGIVMLIGNLTGTRGLNFIEFGTSNPENFQQNNPGGGSPLVK